MCQNTPWRFYTNWNFVLSHHHDVIGQHSDAGPTLKNRYSPPVDAVGGFKKKYGEGVKKAGIGNQVK
jgi:hypothetical protein